MGTPARANRFVMPQREAPALLLVRRLVIATALLYVMLFCWSIYRRIWQVLRIDLTASSRVLTPGATVSTDVITSGEMPNLIRLELVQGAHAQTLIEFHGDMPGVRSLDPRIYHYTPAVTVTPQLLARFTPGPAMLRLTGLGGKKLLRIPPPRVRELQVTLRAGR